MRKVSPDQFQFSNKVKKLAKLFEFRGERRDSMAVVTVKYEDWTDRILNSSNVDRRSLFFVSSTMIAELSDGSYRKAEGQSFS